MRKLARSWRVVVVLGLVASAFGLAATPVLAECVQQENFFPRFTKVAPSANRIVVGTVGTDLWGFQPTPSFKFHVDEVLRGVSPADLVIRGLKSGLPLIGAPACRQNAFIYAHTGDVIAIAYDGTLPGVAGHVTTVAWIKGAPDVLSMQRVQTLSLPHVRELAALPDTSIAATESTPIDGVAPWLGFVSVGLAAALAMLRRRHRLSLVRLQL